MNKLYMLLAAACLSGCEPMSGVRVVREGDSYIVEVSNCTLRDHALVVRYVEVRKDAAGSASEVTCALTAQGEDTFVERWRYGADAKGFQRVGCPALERGAAYKIVVGVRPGAATGQFSLDENGDVKMTSGDCP
jgi:hypothetical protein